MPLEWADEANHKGLAPVLRADFNSVGDGAPESAHSIGIFRGVQVWPDALVILFQQSRAFQIPANTVTNHMTEIFQFIFIRCLDVLKPRWSVVAPRVSAIKK